MSHISHKLISDQKASDMRRAFSDTRKGVIEKQIGYTENTSIYYSLEELKEYIALIESSQRGCQDSPHLGIRFEFACTERSPSASAGHLTLTLTPTKSIAPPTNGSTLSRIQEVSIMDLGILSF